MRHDEERFSGVGWQRSDDDSGESLAAESEGQGPRPSEWEPEEPFRPLGRRASIVSGLLLAGIVMDLVAVVSGLMERSLLADVAGGEVITQAEADANDIRQLTVGAVQGGLFTLTAIAFLFWFSRAYRNLSALGAVALRYRSGWAVGAWFVPILNAWRPKQIANDIWRASDPDLPPNERLEWEGRPVPMLFLAWWLGYLAISGFYSFASRRSIRAETLDELRDVNTLFLAADLAAVLVAVLALAVVRRTTRRQAERAGRLGLVADDDPTPLWRRGSAWAGLLGTLAGFGVQGLLAAAAWSGALDPQSEQSAPAPRWPAGTPPDALLADDFSQEGAWLIRNTRSVTVDYLGGAYRILVKEQGLWSTAQGLRERADALSVEAEATLHAGNERTDFYGVTCLTGSRGSYLFGVSADGYYTIGVDAGGDEVLDLKRLAEDWAGNRFGPQRGTIRIHGECAGQGDETALTLIVNGTKVAEARHRGRPEDFVGVEFFAYSGRGQTDVRFDNLVVRDASPR